MDRFESRLGKAAGYVGAFGLFFLLSAVVVGLGDSNLIWGEDNQYGRIDIPSTKVMHLPAKSFNASVAVLLPGRGNETPSLPLPRDLSLRITPVGGGSAPTIRRDLGTSVNANDNHDDTQIRVWRVTVGAAGDYRVTTEGDFLGIGVNNQVWFGHEGPLPGNIWLWAAGLALLEMLALNYISPRLARKGTEPKRAPDTGMWQSPPPPEVSDMLTLRDELEQARDHGDSDEVERLKAKITRLGGTVPPDRPARTESP